MKVIAFASQKGGSGKTTLAAHLAVEAERVGDGPVALMDADPQGSLTDWWNERESEVPLFAQTSIARLSEHLEEMRAKGIKLLLIDTPPAITSTIGHVVHVADLVVIPMRPSPHDLRAAGGTVDIAERLDKPLVFVLNGAHPRARITTEAAISLSQHGAVADTVMHQRTDFAASMIDGRTVMEVSTRSRSPEEVKDLWTYVKGRLFGRTSHARNVKGRKDSEGPSSLVAEATGES
ncbi:MAG: ParA family protein [Kiloniellales bacterium]|nr:ParA family protein [Kiloniellales bacterium]